MTDEDRHDSGGEARDSDQQRPGDLPVNESGEQTGAGSVDTRQAIELTTQAPPPSIQPLPAKPGANRALLYGVIFVGIGILVGAAIGAMNLNQGKTAPASGTPPEITVAPELNIPHLPRDMGVADADAAGLKGHLITIWNGKLAFRLNVEPIDQENLPGFAREVTGSPRPLSISVNFNTSSGRFLCSQEILLKYNAHPAAATPPMVNGKPARKGSPEATDFDNWQKAELESLRVQEQDRERGKEVFENNLDPDGQLKSISIQGDTACPPGTYDAVGFWSLSTNFPSLDEQAQLLGIPADIDASAPGASPRRDGADNKTAGRKRTKNDSVPKAGSFYMEGEDSIAEYDANAGIIETAAGKTFFVDKSGGEGNAARWQDYRAGFQYKCDQNAACSLTRAGAGVLHARLKK